MTEIETFSVHVLLSLFPEVDIILFNRKFKALSVLFFIFEYENKKEEKGDICYRRWTR